MKNNIHPVERIVRVVAGLAVASLAFWGPQNMWFLLGLIPAATGLVGWCPPYALLGINTAKCCGGCKGACETKCVCGPGCRCGADCACKTTGACGQNGCPCKVVNPSSGQA